MTAPSRGLGGSGHVLLLRDRAGLDEGALAGWLRRGIADGAQLLLPDAVGVDAGMSAVEVLEGCGVDLADTLISGRVRVLPAGMFYVPRQLRRWVRHALDAGYPSVRLLCSVASALTVLTTAQYFLFDAAVEELCLIAQVGALCGFDPDNDPLDLDEVVEHHASGMAAADLHVAAGSGSVVTLAGSVDFVNQDALGAALRAAIQRPAAVLSLDLSRVEFMSGGGCRAIATATAEFRGAGGYVLLVMPPPAIARVLRLTGVDRLPGFEITM